VLRVSVSRTSRHLSVVFNDDDSASLVYRGLRLRVVAAPFQPRPRVSSVSDMEAG